MNEIGETMNCGECGKECELLKQTHSDGRVDLWCYCIHCDISTIHPSQINEWS